MMAALLRLARRLGRRRAILMGGVQVRNERARAFYARFGFTSVGTFQTDVHNHDMMLDPIPQALR
jgi:RimJ/RimL family protein N-acetyltransferase